MKVITHVQRTLPNAKRRSMQMIQSQPAKPLIRNRKSKILQNTVLPVLGGIIIGILASLIIKFVGGKLF